MIRFILIPALLVWALATQAQEAGRSHRMSRKQAVQYALDNSNAMRNIRLDEAAAEHYMHEQRAIGLPQVDGSIDLQYLPNIPFSVVPGDFFGRPGTFEPVQFQTAWNSNAQLRLQQMVFDGRYIIALRAGRAYRELTKRNSKRTEVETAAAVSKAYIQTLVAQQRLQQVVSNRARLEKLLKDTEALRTNGLAQKIDVDRIQVSLNNVLAEEENVKHYAEQALNVLKFQMGLPQRESLELTDQITGTPDEIRASRPTQTLDPTARPEYAILQQNKKLNHLDYQRYRSGYLPSLYFSGNLGTQTFRQRFDFLHSERQWFFYSGLGLRLSWNLFDGFLKNAQMQQAKLREQKSDNDLNNFMESAQLQYNNSRNSFDNAINSLEIQDRNVKLAEEVYKLSQARYKEGVGTNLEVIEAETSLKNAQINYLSALLDAYSARIDMQVALGTLLQDQPE